MVLQQGKGVVIWGDGAVNEPVAVSFHGQVKRTVTTASGSWKIVLDPMPASSTPSAMTIAGSNAITLNNILVGEVWLCSGQSNMEYTMRKNSKVVKEDVRKGAPIDELDHADNDAIRIFLVTSKNLRNPDPAHLGWSPARDSALRSFSAAGYFFAKDLYAQLRIPIGVVSSAVPGSAIEPWLDGTLAPAEEQASNGPVLKIDERIPGKFFPTMVQPLAPFAIKGFLWYQGETNCFQNETGEYTAKMKVLIEGWRRLWNDEGLPFYYVQIAPYYYSKSAGKYPLTAETLPRFWEAQTAALRIPHTGMIVTSDLIISPEDLHPAYKWEIGSRLARWALAETYGKKIVPSGPLYKRMDVVKGTVELQFDYTGSGLVSSDGGPLLAFEIAGEDKQYVPARALIRGNKVIVSSPAVAKPLSVRFEWTETGKANFYNKEGLPAVPFRTDNPLRFDQYKVVRINAKPSKS
ncbi:MAG: sialate O-acetylesterase [Williamsia sp.]|nr:sialate O-acetylesterase [Williamsia sp.]